MGLKDKASDFCRVWYGFVAQDKKYRGKIRCSYILSQSYWELQTIRNHNGRGKATLDAFYKKLGKKGCKINRLSDQVRGPKLTP